MIIVPCDVDDDDINDTHIKVSINNDDYPLWWSK